MKIKMSFLLLLCFITSNIFSYSPYLYDLMVNARREIESDITVDFVVNAWRKNGNVEYGEGEDRVLVLYFDHRYNPDGTYVNRFVIKHSESGRGFFDVKHASKEFLELDAVSQIRHLFKEITFTVGNNKYLLDLLNLKESAFRLYSDHTQRIRAINFHISEEFLEKYCILQENANISSYLPYAYSLSVTAWRKIESDITVEFNLNAWRVNGDMAYGEGKDNYLTLVYGRPYNLDGTYPKEFVIENTEQVGGFFAVRHASKEFLKLDAVSQIRHLFKEITFTVGNNEYLLDLLNLKESAFQLYFYPESKEQCSIDFDISEEFLEKYCILQENSDLEKHD